MTSYLFLHSSWHVFVSDRRACACAAKLGSQLETFWPPASNIFAKHFVWPDAAQLSSARLGSRLLICNELCMPRLAVRIGSIVGRWYNRIVGELLPLTVARVRFMARQIARNAYIIMIIIYYKANVYITRRLSKLCGRSHSKGGSRKD